MVLEGQCTNWIPVIRPTQPLVLRSCLRPTALAPCYPSLILQCSYSASMVHTHTHPADPMPRRTVAQRNHPPPPPCQECPALHALLHLSIGLGFLSMGNVSIGEGAATTFQGTLNHTGEGKVDLVAGANALFTGKYEEGLGDWTQGEAGLTAHVVAALGCDSAGNISFAQSVTSFESALTSDGDTANLKSLNATVRFGSSLPAAGRVLAVEGEGFAVRRLLQVSLLCGAGQGRAGRAGSHHLPAMGSAGCCPQQRDEPKG